MPPRLVEALASWAKVPELHKRTPAASCAEVEAGLSAMLDGSGKVPASVVAHVECCLSCQAELARYHKLLRLLHQLRGGEVALPPGVVTDVLSSLEVAASRRAVRSLLTGRRIAYGSAVAGAAATAATLVVWTLAKSRQPREARAPQEAH